MNKLFMFNTLKFKSLLASSISSGILGIGTIAIIAAPSQAINITPEDDPNVLLNEIINGSVPFNVTFSSIAPGATGIFTDGLSSGVGIDEGIILTSGQAADAVGPNGNGTEPEVSGVGNAGPENNFGASTNNGFPGDAQLSAIVGAPTFDATVIEFTFEAPSQGMISFDYVFASEEYIDFESSAFNDIFGFFLNGVDIALLPVPGNPPVDIDTVNSFTNPGFFVQNISVPAPGDPAPFDLEYDGFTTVLSTVNGMVPAGTNTIKLAIADTSDGILDSASFIPKGSFNFQPHAVPEPTAIVGLLTVGGLGAILKRKNVSKIM